MDTGINYPTMWPGAVPANTGLDRLLRQGRLGGFGSISFRRYGLTSVQDMRIAFRLCSPLAAITSQKATAFTKGKVVTWNPKTEKPVRGEFKDWDKLFAQPNDKQSGDMFFNQAYRYMQQYGYCVIDPTYPALYNDRPSSLRAIPNWAITWDYTGVPYMGLPKSARFDWNGKTEELDVKRLVIVRDAASSEFDEVTGLPLSRYAPMEQEVSNLIAELQTRGQMITDRGANGILSNGAKDSVGHVPIKPDEKERLQQAYKRYGNMPGQDKIIITDADLSYTAMTFNSEQLGLQPEHIACVKALCNTACFPFTMLAEGFEGKYNNSTTARRDFQDQTIDPESLDFMEQLSKGLGMDKQNCEAYMDYSGVASVQQSQQEKGKGMKLMNESLKIEWDNGLITKNDWLDQLGKEKVNNPLFDKYKWELTPEELGMPLPDAGNNQNSDNGNDKAKD